MKEKIKLPPLDYLKESQEERKRRVQNSKSMGTQIETEDLKKLYEVCGEVQESIFEMGVPRVYTVLKIDDRRDKENRTLEEKVKSVKNRM